MTPREQAILRDKIARARLADPRIANSHVEFVAPGFCACGCAERVSYRGNKFLHGHGRSRKHHLAETGSA